MVELHLIVPEDRVEPVSDALIDELGALSVSVEDADVETPAEHALFGEPGMPAPALGWQRSIVKALLDDEAAATEAATLLLAQDWAAGVHVQSLQSVGVDNITFETDYPHSDSTWPHSLKVAMDIMEGLDDETITKIVRTNAIRMLHLDLEA